MVDFNVLMRLEVIADIVLESSNYSISPPLQDVQDYNSSSGVIRRTYHP